MDPELMAAAARLGVALAVGMLIGLERGWRVRELPEGGRVAGLRTFSLIGLLGGVLGLLGDSLVAASAGLLGVAALFAVSYERFTDREHSLSITTAIAGLVTYALGLFAARGHPVIAMGAAAAAALLLGMKDTLHGWMRRIEPAELSAVLQLGVLSAVILPLLPDAGYGPYGAVNPFKLWLAVVILAVLSLSGHFATRLRGPQQGLLWVGLLGGLASSTAATLTLSRAARDEPAVGAPASAAIVAACGVMFVRMAVVVTLLQPSLALRLGGLLVALGIACFAAAAWLWRDRGSAARRQVEAGGSVFDLASALGFGLALGLIAVLVRLAKATLGLAGIYAVAFVSGLADVDAIVISSVQLFAQGELPERTTTLVLMTAVTANMVVKGAMAWTIGGTRVGQRVVAAYLAVAFAGLALVSLGWA